MSAIRTSVLSFFDSDFKGIEKILTNLIASAYELESQLKDYVRLNPGLSYDYFEIIASGKNSNFTFFEQWKNEKMKNLETLWAAEIENYKQRAERYLEKVKKNQNTEIIDYLQQKHQNLYSTKPTRNSEHESNVTLQDLQKHMEDLKIPEMLDIIEKLLDADSNLRALMYKQIALKKAHVEKINMHISQLNKYVSNDRQKLKAKLEMVKQDIVHFHESLTLEETMSDLDRSSTKSEDTDNMFSKLEITSLRTSSSASKTSSTPEGTTYVRQKISPIKSGEKVHFDFWITPRVDYDAQADSSQQAEVEQMLSHRSTSTPNNL